MEETLSWGQKLGTIMQAAYVVADLRKAIEFYQKALGTGPFFVLENVRSEARIYRGEVYPAEVSIAMAFSGNLNVELIQTHDNSPSALREGIERYGYGFHHFGIPFTDMAAAEARYRADGYVEVSRNPVPTGGEVVFFDPPAPAQPGYIELLPVNPGMDETFRRFWDAAQGWDGSDPIRPFG